MGRCAPLPPDATWEKKTPDESTPTEEASGSESTYDGLGEPCYVGAGGDLGGAEW